jgi:beta-glucosidase
VTGSLYPFGYGLSYTTFQYSDLKINPRISGGNEKIRVAFKIKNTGKYGGDEVAQLYFSDLVSSVTVYEKQLRGFERIHLEPGEEKNLEFLLSPDQFSLLNEKMERVTEPGEFEIFIGSSSEDIRLNGRFTISATM